MSSPTLLKPTLYRAQGSEDDPHHPALLGGACECGYVFFPLRSYGCERCGRVGLEPRALSGRGKLIASARVHLHGGKTRQAPFTVGSVTLDDGPIVRTLIAGDDVALPGDRMVTTLVPVTDAEGAERLDLRFTPQR
ncbi:MAG TPA: hypothetical protein VII56_04550 [Rhizomicrobium sp.]